MAYQDSYTELHYMYSWTVT